MRLARHLRPVWQVVVVRVGVVEEAPLLDHQTARVGAQPSRVPAERPAPGHPREAFHRTPHVLALDLFADELVVDPPPPVADDLVAGFDDGGRGLGMALERHGDGEDADLETAFGEHAHEPPEARATAVLVHRLDLEVAHAGENGHADDLLEKRLGLGVAVQDRALTALLVVHDDLERQAGAARPLRIGRSLAIAY